MSNGSASWVPRSAIWRRLRELAREQAYMKHVSCVLLPNTEGHVQGMGDKEWGFSACPHPDCAALRAGAEALAPSIQKVSSDEEMLVSGAGRAADHQEQRQPEVLHELSAVDAPAVYDFAHEARRVTEAIGSNNGWMTVQCALHEAFEAGRAEALAPPEPPAPSMADAAEMLWIVLANVSGGDWTKQTPEWQEAAARWRDHYFAAVRAAASPRADTPST